jgi:hypothetical protein
MRFTMIALFLLTALAFYSCSTKVQDEWPELDSFHMIMAEAFHPYKDSANLEPVKRLAKEMATEADKWAAAPLPEKVDNDEMKNQLKILKADAHAFAEMIEGGAPDETIGSSLTALHDTFHSIMEAWHGGDKHKEH